MIQRFIFKHLLSRQKRPFVTQIAQLCYNALFHTSLLFFRQGVFLCHKILNVTIKNFIHFKQVHFSLPTVVYKWHFPSKVGTVMKPKKNNTKFNNWHFRLPDVKDQLKAIELLKKSGAKNKTEFARKQLLNEAFPTYNQDPLLKEVINALNQKDFAIKKIGVLYNQVVKALNNYHTESTAKTLIAKLEKLTEELVKEQVAIRNIAQLLVEHYTKPIKK